VLEEVVAAAGRDLGGGARRKVGEVDVVDDHVRVVVLAPDLRVHVVEPRVVGRDEMTPLDDLQRVLRRLVRVLRRAGDGRLRHRAAVEEHRRPEPGAS
jgi:hypothetical protein